MTELRRKGRPATEAGATKGAQALDRGLEILQYLANAGEFVGFRAVRKAGAAAVNYIQVIESAGEI